MCEVVCEKSTERSTGVSERLSRSCLWRFVSLDGGDLLLQVCVFFFFAKGSTKWFEEESWLVHL